MCANVIQARTFQLQAPIGTSDVTIAVKNLADIYGNDVEMTGSIQYATLEPESANNQEIISFTGITSVSTNVWNLTGVTRGLDAQPTNGVYGNDVANRRAHASSVDCILSDSPQVWDDKTSKSEAETITGVWTFSASPIVPTPTTADQAATKDYVDGVVASGAADAGTNTKGISRLSYSPTVTIGTATMTIASPCVVSFTAHGLTLNDSIQFTTTGALPTGLNVSTNYFVISTGLTADAFQVSASLGGAAVNTTGSQSGTHTLYKTTPEAWGTQDIRILTKSQFQSGAAIYGTDAGGDDTYVVALTPTLAAYTTGQELRFKPTTANTGACTVDFGAGVLNIKTIDGNDPQSGVIRANMIVDGFYDGTNFVLATEDFSTQSNRGTIELATDAEVNTRTDTVRTMSLDQVMRLEARIAGTTSTEDSEVTEFSWAVNNLTPTDSGKTLTVSKTGQYTISLEHKGVGNLPYTLLIKDDGVTISTISIASGSYVAATFNALIQASSNITLTAQVAGSGSGTAYVKNMYIQYTSIPLNLT